MKTVSWGTIILLGGLAACNVSGGGRLSSRPPTHVATQSYSEVGSPVHMETGVQASSVATSEAEQDRIVAAGRLKLNELVIIEPANGMPAVPALRPSWCSLVPSKKIPVAGSLVEAAIAPIRDHGWGWADLGKVTAGLCAAPDDPDYQRQAGYVVQAWVNQTGTRPDDGVAYLSLAANPSGWAEQEQSTCARVAAHSDAPEREQWFAAAARATYGCGNAPFWIGGSYRPPRGYTHDLHYWINERGHAHRSSCSPSTSWRALATRCPALG